MSHRRLTVWIGAALIAVQAFVPSSALAVGPGVDFGFKETPIPGALQHAVFANSLDFTYHDCQDFVAPGVFNEVGYLWISSFQDLDSVVDSQINHFLPNGYHIYARYNYHGEECLTQDMCDPNKTRKSYGITEGSIQLFIDPLQDTTLAINNCQVVVGNNADDRPLGGAPVVQQGQKTETDDLISGDFEIVFVGWQFSAFGQGLFRDDVNDVPLVAATLVLNGNVTRLQGPLANDHKPEGSGNLYWVD
jgi:hypothetical protein